MSLNESNIAETHQTRAQMHRGADLYTKNSPFPSIGPPAQSLPFGDARFAVKVYSVSIDKISFRKLAISPSSDVLERRLIA